jgi:uncharacterized protein (DUF433 family)
MKHSNTWNYLVSNPRSNYKQLFVKGTRIRAEILYGWTVDGESPMTPQEVAESYDLPLEAVQEAIAYCQSNPPEIDQDHAEEERRLKLARLARPHHGLSPNHETLP